MSDNRSKVHMSRNDAPFTPDNASTGALSRWLETDQQRLRIVVYPVDYVADHTCYDGHAFYIAEGAIRINLGEEITEMKEGDAFIIPDEVPHQVFNPFTKDAKVIVVDNV
ncbi:cupin domain-containing protein [Virgibacillus sp. W0430]|uniref:cupin domain-containing protein n=1 Tax=Virgibacillus sp. W0430 TaxID=3391580 RepID=UPI003F47EF27